MRNTNSSTMKNTLHCLFVFFLLAIGECWSANEPEVESSTGTMVNAEIQEWQENGFFSDDFNELTLSGDLGAEPETYWKTVATDIRNFKHRDKVREILLNHGYISRVNLESLAQFGKVEQLTLGLNPEGVTVPPDELRGILGFKNLKYLYIALHGLKNEHFVVLSELKDLEVLSIDFGSRHMLGSEKNQIVKWSPVKIDDEAARFMARMKSLQTLVIHWPRPEDGQVTFSEKAVMTLLDAPALKSAIRIDSRNFAEAGLRALKGIELPKYVRIDDLRPVP
jgi:hypothetical protein